MMNPYKINKPKPYIGMGVTINYHSDKDPGTIVDISPSGKTIYIQEDNAIRVDHNGMSEVQEYMYHPNPDGEITKATLRKNGEYRVSKSNNYITVGVRRKYYDYSF